MRLTDVLEKALVAIEQSGGTASPVGGGSWRGASGQELRIESTTVQYWVGTKTIYALVNCGALDRCWNSPCAWRDTYELTDKGRALAEKLRETDS